MIVYEACFKPLTSLSPLYVGGQTPLESNITGQTSVYPSIWTLGGAFLNAASQQLGISHRDLALAVDRGDLEIQGAYIRYPGTSGPEVSRIIIPLYGWPQQGPSRAESSTMYFKVPWLKKPGGPRPALSVVRAEKGKARLEKFLDTYPVYEKRIGVKINSKTKSVGIPDRRTGNLYSYIGLRKLYITGLKGGREHPEYCIIVIDKQGALGKLEGRKGVIDLGGKHGVARYTTREISNTPFTTIQNQLPSNEYIIAVSHIPLIKTGNTKLALPNGQTIKELAGRLTILYGWDYLKKKMKTPILTATPGSIIKTEPNNTQQTPQLPNEWYIKTLNTILTI